MEDEFGLVSGYTLLSKQVPVASSGGRGRSARPLQTEVAMLLLTTKLFHSPHASQRGTQAG